MLQGKAKIVGQLDRLEMAGDKKDLPVVTLLYLGGVWSFYGDEDVYHACRQYEIGTPLTVTFELVPDGKAGGNNKLKARRGSVEVEAT